MQNPEAEKSVELLVFEIGDGRFGIDLGTVQEVVRAVLISPLPGGPPVVEGVIDVRGRIVPVYDLRARFAANPRALRADDLFVLARAGDGGGGNRKRRGGGEGEHERGHHRARAGMEHGHGRNSGRTG